MHLLIRRWIMLAGLTLILPACGGSSGGGPLPAPFPVLFSTSLAGVAVNTARSVTFGDFNGDGKLDLAVCSFSGDTLSVFLNSGAASASYGAAATFPTGSNPTFVAAGDFNGDGKPDLVVANLNSNTVSVFLNTTAPGATTATFATKVDLSTGANPSSLALADFNHDGMLDIAVANFGSNTVSVFLNTTAPGAATPSFTAKTDFAVGTGPASLISRDFNGDGVTDLATANSGANSVSILLNTTTPGAVIPSFASKVDFQTGASPQALTAIDVQGDGKPDLAVANSGAGSASILLNQTAPGAATPSFSSRVDFATGSNPVDIRSLDLDGDGVPDLVTANLNDNTISLLLNRTNAGFANPDFTFREDVGTPSGPSSLAVGDADRNGRIDIAIAAKTNNSVGILLNITPASSLPLQYSQTDFIIGTAPTATSVVLADFNGDGVLDVALGGFDSFSVSVFLNATPTGSVTPMFRPVLDLAIPSIGGAVAVGDINGDGKPDIVVPQNASVVSVFLNTTPPGATSASFAARVDLALPGAASSVALGDLNGDGRIDLVATNTLTNAVSVFFNTTAPGAPTPTFAARVDFPTGKTPVSVAIGDLNGDGMPDLVVANRTDDTVSVLLNTTAPGAATPSFAAKSDFPTAHSPTLVVLTDINFDGVLDLAVSSARPVISLLINTTGPGATTASLGIRTDVDTPNATLAMAGDLNNDGKPDLVTGATSVLLNTTPAGLLAPIFGPVLAFPGRTFGTAAIGDLNGDGKPDLLMAGSPNDFSVFLGQ